MIRDASRRPALRFIPDWRERHRARVSVANKPGCRSYVRSNAERWGLRVKVGGDHWSLRKSKRRPAIAVWSPWSGHLDFPTLRESAHVHDVFGLVYEIEARAAKLGLPTTR